MSCSGCVSKSGGTVPKGCNSHGGCTTGGCNRLNTFDWLSRTELDDFSRFSIAEVSFKNGSRKEFFQVPPLLEIDSGDMVVVDTGNGYDLGRISLTGQLVSLQMKKRRVQPDRIMNVVVRRANHRDLERLEEAREMEQKTLVRARAIARMLDLEMKIADIEFQADKRKATFYFTSNGRVDFRELIRHYAKEFRVKIEMRQIGSRQESSRIGGIGSCGRELCCSTWLTTFKSVSTRAARYQNLAINQSKLSGQCGRLKCCLNYELDLYTETLDQFPMRAEILKSSKGNAHLIKVDIFKKLMFYALDERGRTQILALTPEKVADIFSMNKKGILPESIEEDQAASSEPVEKVVDFEDVTGGVELKDISRSSKKKKKRNKNRSDKPGDPPNQNRSQGNHRRNPKNKSEQ